ncbi:TPM domain-containing protein [Flavobacterium amniphilum]|uniref:TPM domain-containing protein n=1 Tax=Flavobacterium amniphilum TaxID=1834035 RepID=UPI0021D47029|nr:TPM domain-containing protein [Flavobacterium amniphilum]
MKNFLSNSDKQEIVGAIIQAEKHTSGEIRVHIENDNRLPSFERAQSVFFELGMDATQKRNGVLFFVCTKSKSLSIIGDEGINKKVDANFWEETKDAVLGKFKMGLFKQGLVLGIGKAATQLQEFFPLERKNRNELTNTISTL